MKEFAPVLANENTAVWTMRTRVYEGALTLTQEYRLQLSNVPGSGTVTYSWTSITRTGTTLAKGTFQMDNPPLNASDARGGFDMYFMEHQEDFGMDKDALLARWDK